MDPVATGTIRVAGKVTKHFPYLLGKLPPIRRSLTKSRLKHLVAGATLDTFVAQLGQPVVRRVDGNYEQSLFVLDDVCVLAATDPGNSVLGFTVTTRSRRFHPRIPRVFRDLMSDIDKRSLRIGLTNYGLLPTPQTINGVVGANYFGYAESFYFGRPGMYQTLLLATSMAGPSNHSDVDPEAWAAASIAKLDEPWGPELSQRFRKVLHFNTYGVVSSQGSAQELNLLFGPNSVTVNSIAYR